MMKRYFHRNFIMGLTLTGLILILSFTLTGCGPGLPTDLKNEAKSIPDIIKTSKSRVDEQTDKYHKLTRTSDFKPVERFATRENWNQKFQLALNELNRAKTLYDKDLKPLVSENKPELAPRVKQQIERIKKVIYDANEISRFPLTRFSKIRETIKNTDQAQRTAKKNAEQISVIVGRLKKGDIEKARTDFPDLSERINTRLTPLLELDRQSQTNLKIVQKEYNNHMAERTTDYAAFTDSSQALASGLLLARNLDTKISGEIAQLYTGYTKILKDMKEEYYVTIKRESWDENSDYYNPGFATFQRQVTPEVYEALTADNLDTVAAITAGFTGSKFKNNIGNAWNSLSINPTEKWPDRRHNAASFWVEDSKEAFFHKYLLEENGETKETDWEKVDASFYDANLEFLGMAILAKPYGMFEKDRIIQATPPGMAYVGNDKYGEWKTDNQGSSFWSWYGKYAMFSMLFNSRPSYYGYNSWNSWNNNYRNSRPYYGKTRNGFQKFGTSGNIVKQSPKYQSTNFAKSGGFKTRTASVRGAGANLRGGGPKSKGK